MVGRVILPLALIAAALFAIYAYLTTRGPFQVDCGTVDPVVCEQVWRDQAAREEGLDSFIPVTRVRVVADYSDEPPECLDIYIERLFFGSLVINDCL